MKAKNQEAVEIRIHLGKVRNTLSIESAIKVADLYDEVSNIADDYITRFRSIMTEYNVPQVKGQFIWEEHEKSEEISNKVTALVSEEHELKNSNVLTKEEVMTTTQGLSVGEVAYLRKFLQHQ